MGGPYRRCSPPNSPWQGGFYMSHFKQGRQDDLKMLNFKWEFKIDIKLTSPRVSKMQEEKKHFSLGWNRKVKIFIRSLPHPAPSSPRWNWQNSSALWQVNDFLHVCGPLLHAVCAGLTLPRLLSASHCLLSDLLPIWKILWATTVLRRRGQNSWRAEAVRPAVEGLTTFYSESQRPPAAWSPCFSQSRLPVEMLGRT